MTRFKMREIYYKEYINPLNRKFHTQPYACFLCGSSLDLTKDKYRKPKRLIKRLPRNYLKSRLSFK